MSVTAYIGVGSNVGDKPASCLRAIDLLTQAGRVISVSSLYHTEPVGFREQDDFINAGAGVETELSPRELLAFCRRIEDSMGRKRFVRWGPRTIDLDILLYGDRVVNETDLIIPHPLMTTRKFVLAPLAEIAPGSVHPVLKKTVAELLDDLRDSPTVIKCKSHNILP